MLKPKIMHPQRQDYHLHLTTHRRQLHTNPARHYRGCRKTILNFVTTIIIEHMIGLLGKLNSALVISSVSETAPPIL